MMTNVDGEVEVKTFLQGEGERVRTHQVVVRLAKRRIVTRVLYPLHPILPSSSPWLALQGGTTPPRSFCNGGIQD